MGGSADKRRSLLSELRRRGVIHVTGLYLVGAWAIVQVVDLVADPLHIPAEAIPIFWLALVLIFPFVLVFGWRYDITREGIVRTDPDAAREGQLPLAPLDHGIIGTLALVISGIVALTTMQVLEAIEHERLRQGVGVEQADEPAPPNSIAVLPFTVCASEYVDEALASGLAAEVINRLAKRRNLKVIARVSSFTMAGFNLSLRQIAVPLRVRYLLTGVLCRDGETLTLSVELVHEDGFVAWSESYEQPMDATGQVTLTLAALVADGVGQALGVVMPIELGAPVNRLAYEQLLIGREHRWQGDDDKARAAIDKALDYEPEYAEAWFELALLESDRESHMTVGTGVKNAWPIGERALMLARRQLAQGTPDFRTHLAAGQILQTMARWNEALAWRQADELGEAEVALRKEAAMAGYAEAEQQLHAAIALNPSETETYSWLAINLERQGVERRAEALEILEGGLARDPFNLNFNTKVANRWAGRGRYRQAIELLERFKALPQIPPGAWWAQLEIMNNQSRFDEKCETLIEMLREDPGAFDHGGNRGQLVWLLTQLGWLGLYEEAEAWYPRIMQLPMPGGTEIFREWFVSSYLYAIGRSEEIIEKKLARINAMTDEQILDAWFWEAQGMADWLALGGDYERAIRLKEALQHKRMHPFWAEREAFARLSLAELYQRTGRDQDAVPLLELVVDDLEAQYDSGTRHPMTLTSLAEAYALLGRDEAALEMLGKAIDDRAVEPIISEIYTVYSPWQRLRDDPRFIVLWGRAQAELDRQAKGVRAMLAQYDIDNLLAPVMVQTDEPGIDGAGED